MVPLAVLTDSEPAIRRAMNSRDSVRTICLGLLVTGLLAGRITTSPLTSTYPWSGRTMRQIRQGLFAGFPGDLFVAPYIQRGANSSVSLRSGGVTSAEKAVSIFGKRRTFTKLTLKEAFPGPRSARRA